MSEPLRIPFRIPSYMVDVRRRLRAVCFMELAQELAGLGAEQLHMSDRDLSPVNGVWVLARMHVDVVSTPSRDDEVILSTWHKGLDGIQYIRDYTVSDADGNALILSTSSWLIMDIDERKILHGSRLEDIVPTTPQCPGDAVSERCRKLVFPRDCTPEDAGSHTVRYSDVDYNGHTNNTKYIMWALDALPDETVFGSELAEFDINYNSESHKGETILLRRAFKDGFHYVEGSLPDGRKCFISKFRFA